MIKIIAVGSLKEKYLIDAVNEYLKRLKKYTEVEIIEIKDENTYETEKNIQKEAEKIEKYISDKEYIITLEINGKEINSEEFAKKIDEIKINYGKITFIIGGSCGLSQQIINRANYHLSFSKMTFPHQLFRVILLEQIYRAYKINNNEKYHK